MTAPLRLLEDGTCSGELRRALSELPTSPAIPPAIHWEMTALTAQLVSFGLGAAGLGTVTTAAHGSLFGKALSWIVSAKLLTQIVLGTVLLTAFGAVGYSVADQVMTKNAQPRPSERVLVSSEERPRRAATQPFEEPASKVTPVEPEAKSPPSAVQGTTKTTPITTSKDEPPDESSELRREARMLEVARSRLGSDPGQALEIALEHGSIFPEGQLRDERELIVTDALLRLGRRSEAWQRAEPRLHQSPKGLYAKRLRQLFGIHEPEE